MRQKISRPFFLALGFIALGLGCVGVFVPLLPTTPFVLVAAFAFSRSSRKLHGWLLGHKYYGALISNWQEHGVIRPRVKWTSALLIVALGGTSLFLVEAPAYAKLLLAGVCACVIYFILTRPGEAEGGGG